MPCLPKTRTEWFERIVTDPEFFLSTCCQVNDIHSSSLVPFRFNSAQRRYADAVCSAGVVRDIVAKPRKHGFSTVRLGYQLHGVLYRPGRIGRTVVQRWDTAKGLGKIVKTLYATAWKFFEEMGEDPKYFMPVDHSGDVRIINLGSGKGGLFIETAGGQGVGQADRTDDLYITEYADWEHPTEAFDGLVGSMPVGGKNQRLTVDFNANEKWMSSDAYILWTGANAEGEDWNGFTPFFVGVLDVPEIYSPEELEERRHAMRERYCLSYPETPDDLLKQRDLCCFNLDHLRNCTDTGYTPRCERYVHGIDTATGVPGGDWQVCVTLGWTGERWVQVAPAIRVRVPEDVFAGYVDGRIREYPGVGVVERNVGSAVLTRLRELGTPGLYKHRFRDKDGKQVRRLGFPTTYASKRIMISEMQRALSEGTIGLVDQWIVDELRDFEWKEDQHLAGAPDRANAHDDGAMAAMLALAGTKSRFTQSEEN